jgi:hypothetical protein
MKKGEREYYLWCVEQRLDGVHPNWFPLWCGSNPDLAALVEWLKKPNCSWPTERHFEDPLTPGDSFYYQESYNKGLPIWNAIKEKMDVQDPE